MHFQLNAFPPSRGNSGIFVVSDQLAELLEPQEAVEGQEAVVVDPPCFSLKREPSDSSAMGLSLDGMDECTSTEESPPPDSDEPEEEEAEEWAQPFCFVKPKNRTKEFIGCTRRVLRLNCHKFDDFQINNYSFCIIRFSFI